MVFMEKKSEKNTGVKAMLRPNLIKIILVLIFAILILVVVLLPERAGNDEGTTQTTAGSQTTSQTTASGQALPELVIHSLEEQGEWVHVSTSYCDFVYPLAYSDLLEIDTVNNGDCVALVFMANLQDTTEPVYRLWINAKTGAYVGELTANGDTYSLYVEVIEPRQNLDSALLDSYYAAQETLNDVLQSMENSGSLRSEG